MPEVYSVSHCLGRLSQAIEREVGAVWVEGEVVNLSRSPVGHYYFSLKDEKASLNCAFFKFDAVSCRDIATLVDGDKIKVYGKPSIYPARGTLQIVVKKLLKSGKGNLVEEFEKLKKRLAAEGLFDPENKKPIPKLPECVGVITAPESAALQDFLNVYKRRSFKMDIKVYPSLVQGEKAAGQLRKALESAIRDGMAGKLDVIVITRGGGATEDLWCFNDEGLAWDIFNSPVPIVSAVGHQIDFTIADFVADKRCETPTAAAQELTEYQMEVISKMDGLGERLKFIGSNLLSNYKHRLSASSPQKIVNTIFQQFLEQKERFSQLSVMSRGAELLELEQKAIFCDDLMDRAVQSLSYQQEKREARLNHLFELLSAYAPQNTLNRGFCYLEAEQNQVVSSIKDFTALEQGSPLSVVFKDGRGKVQKS